MEPPPRKVTDKPIMKIMNNQQDIKKGKLSASTKCLQKYRRQENSMNCYIDSATPYITEHNREMDKRLHPSFPQEKLSRNYQERLRHNSYF